MSFLVCLLTICPLLSFSELPPGIVITHSCANSGIYIGSPGIVVVQDGIYLAKHDEFGPMSTEHSLAVTHVYSSEDSGNSWERIATLRGMFWSNIFKHNGSIYMMGTDRHHGNIVIRKSDDGGYTWTEPMSRQSGILRIAQFHTAPVPVVVFNGRIWRAFEDAMGGDQWGERYRAFVMSAPVDSNLLDSKSWTFSNCIARSKEWLNGEFNGWLEGNIVPTPDGKLVNVLRVDIQKGGKAAVVQVNEDGKKIHFDPETGFVNFNGGTTKFTIRFDGQTKKYWTLCNWPSQEEAKNMRVAQIRNTLVLANSPDLRDWKLCKTILHHPDIEKHGFQYADWLFEGDDIIAVVRTAYDDDFGGANNFHDANYLTFHRIENFRN
ncbi:MAG TPA: sialidase family protein [Candidatus Hydrogenedens sp.]|nr:sialidase family protein [Candidatus Hydrogenedens sp.]